MKQISGGKFTPPTNPPDVTYLPWNPLTLVISHSKALNFQVKSVLDYLRAQVDPTKRGFNQTTTGDSRFVVQFRLLSIMAWNLSGRVISLSVDDFTDSSADAGGRDQLCGLVDTGTTTHTPAVGYYLPMHAQQHVLRTDTKQSDMFLFDVSGTSGQFVTYVKILYRFDGPVNHPTILSPVQDIEKTLNKISNKILKQKETSTLELIWNGVKYTAEAVAVIGAVTSPANDLVVNPCSSVPRPRDVSEVRDNDIESCDDVLVAPFIGIHLEDSCNSSYADVDDDPSSPYPRIE